MMKIEKFIEAVKIRLYNIRQEKISSDNVYQFLLLFGKLQIHGYGEDLSDNFIEDEKQKEILLSSVVGDGS